MDILNQCRDWLHQGNYLPVIAVLENMPKLTRALELDLLLSEAYFGIAKSWIDRPLYQKAIQRLLLHKEEMAEDFWWNIRLGQAYFNTNQFGRALPHYRKARLLRPDLNWVEAYLKESKQRVNQPAFNESFAQRVERAWKAFGRLEGDLRSAIHGDIEIDKAREAFGKIDDTLEIACESLAFSVAGGGSKAELILSPQGNWCRFYELAYFISQTPDFVLDNWEVRVGRQPTHRMRIGVKDVEVSAEDVKVWLDKDYEGNFQLSVYCEKLAFLAEEDKDQYFWAMVDLIDNSIGELPRMRYFNSFEVLSEPKDSFYVELPQLASFMEKEGLNLSLEPLTYIHNFTSYLALPRKDSAENECENKLGWDIYEGTTNCAQLLEEYSQGKDELANDLIADGAVPGVVFFVPPYGTDLESNLAMLEELQEYMISMFDPTTLTITGTAKGHVFWYVDFIAWSLPGALESAEVFFQKKPIPSICGFQILHTDADPMFLKGEEKMASVAKASRIIQ